MQKKFVVICFLNFLVAALMGLALRYVYVGNLNVNYRYLTHAHSHVAMLGWVYLMLYVCLVHYFVPEKRPIYNRLYWVTQFAVLGMMISFPFQGYAVVSISFSTLHILCSYYFVYLVWNKINTTSIVNRKLLKMALVFMVLSTLGVWCLGPAVSMQGKASAFYQIAIQFFLHFQFNGWFLLATIAILFRFLRIENSKQFQLFFNILIASVILTLALPIHWFVPSNVLLWVNGIGISLQVLVLILFVKIIQAKIINLFSHNSIIQNVLVVFALFCFGLKIIIQVLTLIPEFSNVVYEHRNFIIGFIHLIMLGVISGFLLLFVTTTKLVRFNKTLAVAVYSFILGFLLTEVLLLIQGCSYYFKGGLISNYYLLLFLFSILLPLGIALFLINIVKTK